MAKFLIILSLSTLMATLGYGIKPNRNYQFTPKDYQLNYSELKVKTKDNFSLNVWDIHADSTNDLHTSIVICGGDAGNMSNYLLYAFYLAKSGFNVILFDYRGFGKSDNFSKLDINMLYHDEFMIDYETVLEYATKVHPGTRIGVLTFSMGGLLPLISNKKIDFYIGDCPLLLPQTVLVRLNEPELKTPPQKPITDSYIPMLLFMGFDDEVIKYEDIATLKEHNSDITLVMFNGRHGEGFSKLKDSYIGYITNFVTNKKE